MIGIARALVVSRMTRIAIRRQPLELAGGCTLMAGIAIDRGVRPGEWKAIVMLLHLLNRNHPSPHRVALFTIRAQLPFVNVSVTVLAAQPNVRKYLLHVTLRASHRFVHAPQRIPGLIVIELGNSPDRFPGASSVAVLARKIQATVRTVCARSSLGKRPCRRSGKSQQQDRP